MYRFPTRLTVFFLVVVSAAIPAIAVGGAATADEPSDPSTNVIGWESGY
jgi:hypothetical protein